MADRARMRGARDGGFALIELIVAMIILAILMAVTVHMFRNARTQSRNRSVTASAQTLFAAISNYNHEWPVLPGGTYGDPLAGGQWDGSNWSAKPAVAETPGAGLTTPTGDVLLREWPENPWRGAAGGPSTYVVYRGGGGGAPGTALVTRLASPAGAFRFTAWAMSDDGNTAKIVMQRTHLAGGAGWDCGYSGAPMCP